LSPASINSVVIAERDPKKENYTGASILSHLTHWRLN